MRIKTTLPPNPGRFARGSFRRVVRTESFRPGNSHSEAFQLQSASIEAYKCSFFPQTIRDWNDLPDSLFSTAEMSDDCVSKFVSLVRSRD